MFIDACFGKVSSSIGYIVVNVQRATKLMNSVTLNFFQCIVLQLLYSGGKGVSDEWEYETLSTYCNTVFIGYSSFILAESYCPQLGL